MIATYTKVIVAAACAVALTGCAGPVGSYRVENATGQPIPHHALADEVFLDGTGPTARRLARIPATKVVERRYAEPSEPRAPTRSIARSRPTAIPRTENAPSTTGSRTAVQNDASALTFNEWLEKERREDVRLRDVMRICRGC